MALTKEEKAKVLLEYRKDEKDCGSVEVQVALLTAEIKKLNEHLNSNIHDFNSKRGLFVKIGHRRRLLVYLDRIDHNRYLNLIAKVGLRK